MRAAARRSYSRGPAGADFDLLADHELIRSSSSRWVWTTNADEVYVALARASVRRSCASPWAVLRMDGSTARRMASSMCICGDRLPIW